MQLRERHPGWLRSDKALPAAAAPHLQEPGEFHFADQLVCHRPDRVTESH
jgi:hypothetical protein